MELPAPPPSSLLGDELCLSITHAVLLKLDQQAAWGAQRRGGGHFFFPQARTHLGMGPEMGSCFVGSRVGGPAAGAVQAWGLQSLKLPLGASATTTTPERCFSGKSHGVRRDTVLPVQREALCWL